jgi:uncharacterized membrane protein YtjA (UPF0391 family)
VADYRCELRHFACAEARRVETGFFAISNGHAKAAMNIKIYVMKLPKRRKPPCEDHLGADCCPASMSGGSPCFAASIGISCIAICGLRALGCRTAYLPTEQIRVNRTFFGFWHERCKHELSAMFSRPAAAARITLEIWRTRIMLYWAAVFFVIALVAGVLGFGGIAVGAAQIAQILFFVFLVLFIVSLLVGGLRRGGPTI